MFYQFGSIGIFLQLSEAQQWHRKVHFKLCLLQLQCFVEHGSVFLHPHFINLIRADG